VKLEFETGPGMKRISMLGGWRLESSTVVETSNFARGTRAQEDREFRRNTVH